jgi:V/A-type H+-transporting ATPase subunit C
MLTRQTADIYSETAKMLPEKMGKVFSFLLRQWDIRNLKTILRGVNRGITPEDIMSKIVPYGKMESETLKKMADSSSVGAILPLFEGTCYDYLAAMLPVYEQEKSLLSIESLLDRMLLEEMWNTISSDMDLQALRPGFAAKIDAINLRTIFRAKQDHLLLSDIEKHLISGGDLPRSVLNVFDEVDEVGTLLAELEGTLFYKPLMEVMPECEKSDSIFPLEKVLDETALSAGKQTSLKQPYGIAPIMGYLSMKDAEVRNIMAISRAKEAGMDAVKIREFILEF